MKAWPEHLIFAGSLRRFLLLWLVGGLALVLASVTLWQVLRLHQGLAQAQDLRLRTALNEAAQRAAGGLPASASASAGVALPATTLRISRSSGEWLAGDRGFPACPWPGTLPSNGGADFYVTQVHGTLMRVAAARQRVADDGGLSGAGKADMPDSTLVLQVAAPWAERWPAWQALSSGALPPLYVAAALWAALVWAGVAAALAWIARAQAALAAPIEGATAYKGPAELQPMVERSRALHREQHDWVDQQRRFLADASHQLRTPMAVLRTQLQAAIAGDTPAAEALPQMLHTVDRATGLANQLLSLSKLEQLKRRGELQAIDLHEIASAAVLELSPLIAAKRLDFTLDEGPFIVPAEASMLGELIRNLLANAIHHAPAGARLGVVLRHGAQQLEMIVWDEGPGIDDEVRPRLFHPFASAQGGVGLGLSICRQIAESMGASVHLYNRTVAGQIIGVDAAVSWGQAP